VSGPDGCAAVYALQQPVIGLGRVGKGRGIEVRVKTMTSTVSIGYRRRRQVSKASWKNEGPGVSRDDQEKR
jgi:hypothetical protein